MFINRFKDTPKNKYVIILTAIGLMIVFLIYLLVFIPIEAAVPIYGILDYEFAWTPDKVQLIFISWGAEGITRQSLAIYWDFVYIFGYVSLSLGLLILISRKSEGVIQSIGFYFTLAPFLTGILDIIENTNLLIMFGTPTSVSAVNSFTASFCALLKFVFLFAAIVYFTLALIIFFVKKIKTHKPQ